MSSPLTFGLSDAYRRLGIKSGILPSIAPGTDLLPVMLFGDLSRSLASEVFEARAVCGGIDAGAAGFYTYLHLMSRSRGGCVVESLQASTASNAIRVYVSNTPGTFTTSTVRTLAQVGGIPAVNTYTSGRTTAATAPNVTIAAVIPVTAGVPVGDRWYIPAGSTLEVWNGNTTDGWSISMQWRELSAIQGQP